MVARSCARRLTHGSLLLCTPLHPSLSPPASQGASSRSLDGRTTDDGAGGQQGLGTILDEGEEGEEGEAGERVAGASAGRDSVPRVSSAGSAAAAAQRRSQPQCNGRASGSSNGTSAVAEENENGGAGMDGLPLVARITAKLDELAAAQRHITAQLQSLQQQGGVAFTASSSSSVSSPSSACGKCSRADAPNHPASGLPCGHGRHAMMQRLIQQTDEVPPALNSGGTSGGQTRY